MKRTNKSPFEKPTGSMIMNEGHSSFHVLTNDPSTTAWGWAVLNEHGKVLDAGCIKTKKESTKRRIRKGDDDMRRVSEINHTLKKVIDRWDVCYILGELPSGGSKSSSAARALGTVSAMLQTIGDMTGIAVEWYSEGDAKKAALGRISCTKQQMVDAMYEKYPNQWGTGIKYKDEAVADALAVHYVAMQQSALFLFITH